MLFDAWMFKIGLGQDKSRCEQEIYMVNAMPIGVLADVEDKRSGQDHYCALHENWSGSDLLLTSQS